MAFKTINVGLNEVTFYEKIDWVNEMFFKTLNAMIFTVFNQFVAANDPKLKDRIVSACESCTLLFVFPDCCPIKPCLSYVNQSYTFVTVSTSCVMVS